MHQIRFRPGLCSGPRWGNLQRSPDPVAGLRGPTSKVRGRKGTGKEGRGGEGREEVGEGQGTGEWKVRGRNARERGGEGRKEREGSGKEEE